jgi:hypothetical protein
MILSFHHVRLVALLCATALTASATAPSSPALAANPTPSGVGFVVAPAGRPMLRFNARPGATITGRVRVQNLDASPRTVRLSPSDLVTADTGGLSFPARAPITVGAWLIIDHPLVRLPGNGERTVRFHATVPADAATGQHFAGIVAVDTGEAVAALAPAKQTRGVSVRHLTRLALPVRLTAPGLLVTHLAVTRITFGVDAAGSSLRVGLHNDGNEIIRATTINLKVSKGGRKPLVIHQNIKDFIPASAISVPAAWSGQVEQGTYRVTGVIRPHGGSPVHVDQNVTFGAKLARQLERKTGNPAAAKHRQPIWLWIILTSLLTAVGGVTLAYIRLRRTVSAPSR